MTPAPTLGRGLIRSLALATIIGMALFGAVTVVVIYVSELGERCLHVGDIEDPPLEIIEQCGIAFAFALPFGLGLAVLLGRQLTRGTTQRLDTVLASARSMTGEHLDQRLPVSEANDPLDRLSDAINGVLARIERGVAAQRQFAADASHELRTPLTVISTNLEVARRKPREPAHWEHVADDTLAEVKRMTLLVDKLLLLSRAGAAGLTHARTDLRPLVASVAERLQTIANDRKIRLDVPVGPPVYAEIDAEAIRIVVDNLIRNAIDHSPDGDRVVINVGPGPRFLIEDHGPGIPVDQRTRIFEPFARGHHDTDRAAGTGMGLGLAICKRIVDGHRGSIRVEDRPAGGARFVVELRAPEP
ncbi:MAG TPA: HAMP domain-containing sensor histidine kinase [Kofleriaceae bacterium]|nr:HAMP domain-containing sensor histidine kinase [Kofleriaceae bacterium]